MIHMLYVIENFSLYLWAILSSGIKQPFRYGLIFKHMDFIGVESTFIISLTGFFTGSAFALQIGGIFSIFRVEDLTGGATGLAMATELAPLVTAFLLIGRTGSAMTAEIATMKVGEQIDAMEAMGVDPIEYLVVPRVLAAMFMMPLLCGVFMLMGMVGAYATSIGLFSVDIGSFHDKLVVLVPPYEVFMGLRKMFVFSFLIVAISCHHGLKASQGAKGVGLSTTLSVVHSLLSVLLVDFFISYIQIRWASL